MKSKIAVLVCLMAVVVLSLGFGRRRADSELDKPVLKIGVVSIRKIFQDCKRNAKYREEALAERDKVEAELEQLAKEIESDRVGLKALKEGSSDQMAAVKQILTKQANLRAQEEFYKQQIELKDQRWTEGLYEEVLSQSSEVAEQKGLALVLERDDVELPVLSANELMMTIRTHKVLYSGGCMDITDEVMAMVDGGI